MPWGSMPGSSDQPGYAPPLASAPRKAAPANQYDPGGNGAFVPGVGRTPGGYNALNPGTDGRAAPGWATDTIRNRYTDAMGRTGDQAQQAENTYTTRAAGFNAQDYATKTAQGLWGQFMPQLNRDIGTLRGQQVGMGRLNTGFATEDEDRLVTESTGRFSDQLASLSMDAAGLDLRNTEGIGNYAGEQGNRYLDLLSGQYDRKMAEQNAKKGGGVGDWLKAGASAASLFI